MQITMRCKTTLVSRTACAQLRNKVKPNTKAYRDGLLCFIFGVGNFVLSGTKDAMEKMLVGENC